MKKKIFVNKNSRSGVRSYLKYLFWAAIGLVVLVLFIPLSSRQKSGREVAKKPAAEKGRVVREIPRSLQPMAESITKGQEGSGEAPKEADSRQAAIPGGKGPGVGAGTVQPPTAKEKPAEPPIAAPQKAESIPEVLQKSIAGRPGAPEPATGQAMKEAQPAPTASEAAVKETQAAPPKKPEPAIPSATETKPKDLASVQVPAKTEIPPGTEVKAPAAPSAATTDKQKPAPSGGRTMYAVQIATLKDKQGAEELKKSLQKRGFDVVMKTTNDPKQGQIYSLQLQPVDNMGKASTLMEQVKYVPQAKPSIVTIPPGN